MMHRLALLTVLMTVGACSSRAPTSPVPTPVTPSPRSAPTGPRPETTLRGTIGGRPFVARSALMVVSNAKWRQGDTPILVSRLHVYEHEAACDQIEPEGWHRAPMQPGEHSIELFITAPWPVFEGSRWDMSDNEQTHDQIDAVFYRQGYNGGAIAGGTVSFPVARDSHGVLSVDLRSKNMNSEVAGEVRGDVPFSVCH